MVLVQLKEYCELTLTDILFYKFAMSLMKKEFKFIVLTQSMVL